MSLTVDEVISIHVLELRAGVTARMDGHTFMGAKLPYGWDGGMPIDG